MNLFHRAKQAQNLALLVEGCSIRLIGRITETHRETIIHLMVRTGSYCHKLLDNHLQGYQPASVVSCRPRQIEGYVPPEQVSTSPIEQQNLTVRICMRRMTRLTNAFSKKLDNLIVNYMYNRTDTIYGFATAAGKSGVAVLRLSGSEVSFAIKRLTQGAKPTPRQMSLRRFFYQGEILDRGLLVYFPAPYSWTGEDVAELHIHGSMAVRQGLMRACADLGLRLAEAGEFSKRAFLNGKADLIQLEGLADLVAAETEAQRKQALRQMEGAASSVYQRWRLALLKLLASMEAQLDFPEEVENQSQHFSKINQVKTEIETHLNDNRLGERLREGVHIALVGGANAGKSTLFNLLANRKAAIISKKAGTTRDVLEIELNLRGYLVLVSDLAGLRKPQDDIEAEGIKRAEQKIKHADLRIIILAADITEHDNDRALSHFRPGDIVIVNKIDIFDQEIYPQADFNLSLIKKDQKIENLIKALINRVEALCFSGDAGSDSVLITRARHREALADCYAALARARRAYEPELMAEDLRLALVALGRITGSTDTENMLDQLFSEFCIGK